MHLLILCYEFEKKGLSFLRQITLPITYLKLNFTNGMLLNFKIDLMKEGIHSVFK